MELLLDRMRLLGDPNAVKVVHTSEFELLSLTKAGVDSHQDFRQPDAVCGGGKPWEGGSGAAGFAVNAGFATVVWDHGGEKGRN